jgi:hypothetical protein
MPLPPLFTCYFCQTQIDPKAPGVYRQVTGWAKNRKDGGTNSIALPEPGLLYACKICIDVHKSKHNPGQGELFGG